MKKQNYLYTTTVFEKTTFILGVLLMLALLAGPVVTTATFTGSENTHEEQSTDSNGNNDSKHDKKKREEKSGKITICHATGSESNPYVKITVSSNAFNAHDNHQNGEDVFADINGNCPGDDRGNNGPINETPTITLIGDSIETIFVGVTYTDLGATAMDYEDGDITSKIVTTGTVDSNLVGQYKIVYAVSDSNGLSATPVERTVNVVENITTNTNNNSGNKGKISFCLILADENNKIATSSDGLPTGKFTINLATTTSNIASTTIRTQVWQAGSFIPSIKTILVENDSDCVTYDDLDYDTYLYSSVMVDGSDWVSVLYNDQNDHSVNSISDFYPYGNVNTNSDGVVIIGDNRPERTVYIYGKYTRGTACFFPEFTSPLNVNVTVNQSFSYNLVPTSTPVFGPTSTTTTAVNYTVETSALPLGLTYSTTTHMITGVPTLVGTYNIKLSAFNSCDINEKTLVINVTNPDGNGGGGGGSLQGANLSVVKVSDVSSANASSTVVYTITIKNDGPELAKEVKVIDSLSSLLDFVSASTTVGSYSTTTSQWNIGDLENGSTTTLTITVNIKSGTEGQKITNTANATSTTADPDNTNNTSTVDVSINPLNPPTPPSGGGGGGGGSVVNVGGGGGGGGGGNGPIVGSFGVQTVSSGGGSNTGTSTVGIGGSCSYLNDYLRKDFNNDPLEVTKLQAFLRIFEGESALAISAVYDDATIDAVNRFQVKYFDDILAPWGHTGPTGYTYILTKKKVNEIFCDKLITLSQEDQNEIISYKNRNTSGFPVKSGEGADGLGEVGYGTGGGEGTISGSIGGSQGTSTKSSNDSMTTLAALTSTTRNIANAFTASTVSITKKLSNLLLSLFGLSTDGLSSGRNQCELGYNMSKFMNLFLLLVIALILFLWYRQYRKNKKIYEINKEIDLEQ